MEILTKAQISAFMADMGRKGGLIGGKRCLETMSPAERSARALHAARVRWAKTAKARRKKRQVQTWSKDAWPIGTMFDYLLTEGTMTNCVIMRYTAARVYWFWPKYDAPGSDARRCRLDEFKAQVMSGAIRKVRRHA